MYYDDISFNEIKKEWKGSLKAYIIGFIGSIILSLISFALVIMRPIDGHTLIYTIVALALVQAIVQLIFFLHLGQEDKPKWETLTFLFMVLVLLIIAIGSLWVMSDLDERVMSDMRGMSMETAGMGSGLKGCEFESLSKDPNYHKLYSNLQTCRPDPMPALIPEEIIL